MFEQWEEHAIEEGRRPQTCAGSVYFWEQVRADLAREKPRHPTPEAIRRALASGHPVPEWAADYIAGRLAGTIKLPRGVPAWSGAGLLWSETPKTPAAVRGERQQIVRRVRRWQQVFEHPDYADEYLRRHGRLPPRGGAYRKALDQVAEESGIPAETLDKMVYPRRKERR